MQAENIGPADELGELRAEIKRLKAREDALRPVLLRDESARFGKRYIVTVARTERDHVDVDRELLERDYPEAYAATLSVVRVARTELRLSGVSEDGEPISLRELRRHVDNQEAS